MTSLPHSSGLPANLPEGLHGLARLARDGEIDVRPVLLRVLTDLYVGREQHTFEEMRQYETIASGLLERTDVETRTIVARKLAACGAAPPALCEKIVAAGGAPAAAILAQSNVLPRAWLLSAALGEPADLAVALATRSDLDAELCGVLGTRPEIEIARALADNMAAPLEAEIFQTLVSRAAGDRQLARALCLRARENQDISPLFLAASHRQRAAILLAARRADLGGVRTSDPDAIELATAAEIESAAVNHDAALFAAILARALGVPVPVARELVEDASGEALALVLCALKVTANSAARIFMCAGESIAHDASRVRALTKMVAEIAPATARRIINRIVDRSAPTRALPMYLPASNRGAASAPGRPADNSRPAENPVRRGGLLFMGRRA